MQKLTAPLFALALLTSAATAQTFDYNPDGTPTLRTQCLQSPGLCDDTGSDGSYATGSDPIGDAIGALIVIGIGCALSGLCAPAEDAPKSN